MQYPISNFNCATYKERLVKVQTDEFLFKISAKISSTIIISSLDKKNTELINFLGLYRQHFLQWEDDGEEDDDDYEQEENEKEEKKEFVD